MCVYNRTVALTHQSQSSVNSDIHIRAMEQTHKNNAAGMDSSPETNFRMKTLSYIMHITLFVIVPFCALVV